MRVPNDHSLAETYALRDPNRSAHVLRILSSRDTPFVREACFELMKRTNTVSLATAAFHIVVRQCDELARDAVLVAIQHSATSLRIAAIEFISQQQWIEREAELLRVLKTDASWICRRAALNALAIFPNRMQILLASSDPHWRVRQALLRHLEAWGATAEKQLEILVQLDALSENTRVRGIAAFLRARWYGEEEAIPVFDPISFCTFWDWDAAVLARKLQVMSQQERQSHLNSMPFLARHSDERIWRMAIDTMRACGNAQHFLEVLLQLNDPRDGTQPAAERLLHGLDTDERESLLHSAIQNELAEEPLISWAKRQLGCVEPMPIRFHESNPFRRAEALTPARAAELIANPTLETSWAVLEAAARIMKVPMWELEPIQAVELPQEVRLELASLQLNTPRIAPMVELGQGRLRVSRLGISGHYLLPTEGFVRAAEAGVNWFFWEPNYSTLTAFIVKLAPEIRRQFHIVAGTFEAEGKRIRKDVERALRMLKIEQLSLFLIFWVQSWERLTDDIRETLERLQAEGKVVSIGLSSHQRPLLVRAMAEGWNPIMARHSAAHRGAEEIVFPAARQYGTSVITFNNTSYGRLLKSHLGLPAPTAAECYRYTLNFPEVSACWSAPATLEQLDANLEALHDSTTAGDRFRELQLIGEQVYREEKCFNRYVRQL